jgi:RNA polymerase sigma factor (sigma-70 family)
MTVTDVEPADVDLLQRIAENQDQQAFSQLFERYQKRGYRIARYITHDIEGAEEALQEAMITIWNSAGSYNGTGKAESWIMTIITHAAVRQIRLKKRKRTEPLAEDDQHFDGPLPHIRMADTEMVVLLRKALVGLTAPERQLLALRFAAGMSQPEISAALRIPQQTVSYRIDAIIKRLRSLLPKSDFSAALPLAEILRELILSGGKPAPASVYTRVIKSIAQPQMTAQRRSSRVSRSIPKQSYAVAAMVLAAVGFGAAVCLWKPAVAANPPAVAKTQAPVPTVVAAVPAAKKFSYAYTFENGIATDLKLMGASSWDKEHQALATQNVSAIIFPFELPKKPVKVSCELIWQPDKVFSCAVNPVEPSMLPNGDFQLCAVDNAWTGDSTVSFGTGPAVKDIGILPSGRRTFVAYLWGNTITEFFGEYAARVITFAEPLAGKKLTFKFTNSSVVSIKAEEVDDIPPQYTDIKRLTAGLEHIHH